MEPKLSLIPTLQNRKNGIMETPQGFSFSKKRETPQGGKENQGGAHTVSGPGPPPPPRLWPWLVGTKKKVERILLI